MKARHGWMILAVTIGVVAALGLLWRLKSASNPALAQTDAGIVHVAKSGSDTLGCGGPISPCATIQYAVDVARDGDRVKVATGVYTDVHTRAGLTQVLYISESIVLQGGYTTTDWGAFNPISYPVTLDAQGRGRVFSIVGPLSTTKEAISPTVEGLHITGGDATGDMGGGLYVLSASLTLRNNHIFSNTADKGGGLSVVNATVTVQDNWLFNNTAGDAGGGMYIANVLGEDGGNGGQVVSVTATLIGNQVFSNTAGGAGGGVYVVNEIDEFGPWDGELDATAIISGNLVSDNVAQGGGGGGLYVYNAGATLSGNAFVANTAESGGGLYLGRCLYCSYYGTCELDGNIVTANHADQYGGGAFLAYQSGIFEGNILAYNTAGKGGGLYSYHSGGTFTNTIVADNQAHDAGSGLYFMASWSHLFHTTVARNRGGDGSGILITWNPVADIIPFSHVALTNTLIASQTVGITVTTNTWGTLGNTARLDGVLWFSNSANTGGTGAITVTHAYTGNPAFAADGYHLTGASAAIDQGVVSGVAADIDGDPRPVAFGYDLGADEFLAGLQVSKHAHPDPVEAGARLTYTLRATNTGVITLHATVTDTLPEHVLHREGTTVLPGGQLVWRPVITPDGAWVQQVGVTVALHYADGTIKIGYAGPLTNVVHVTTLEGAGGVVTQTATAVLDLTRFIYLPLTLRNYPRYENVLVNPGFEGIGVPEDNDAPQANNWTQDTFNGEVYNEIQTPAGWVTWWEEGEYRRPEAKVIPRQPPYTYAPVRILQGYYAAMYFTFYGRHNAGYYQRVTGLTPGAPVRFYAHAHSWSCYSDDFGRYSCGNEENLGFRVGVDPDGGTDPWSPNVIWSARVSSPDFYRRVGPVQATVGPGGAVTVFMRSDVQWWPYKHSDAYWDNAVLLVPVP